MAERIRGLSIGLDLESAGITRSLSEIRRSFNTLNSDLKLTSNNFKYTEKSTDSYKQRIRELDGTVKTYKKNVGELSKEYERVKEEQGENSKQATNLRKEYNKQANELNRLERELGNTTEEFKRFQKEADYAAKATSGSLGKIGKQFSELGPKFKGIGDQMKGIGQSMSMYVTAPIAAGFGMSVKTAADFEAEMARVGAISQSSKSDMKAMSDQAIELGANTSKSAQEVALGMEELAAMGFDAKEIMGAMPGVIAAAEASGADMAQTSKVMASAMNAFGLEASESTHIADVLAQTANQSAADITDMEYALKYAAAPAKALGMSLEETSAGIGMMVDAGLKGEQAGTTLRGALLGLLDPSEENSKLMDKMGIEITDAEGNFVGLAQLVENLSTSMDGMTDTQKAANLASLVGKEAVSGMLVLMEKGPDQIRKMTKGLEESDGASKKAADQMKNNLKGSLEQLGGAFESLGIQIGTILSPVLRGLADLMAKIVDGLGGMPHWLQVITVAFAGLAAAIGPIVFGLGAFISVVGSAMSTLGPLIGSVNAAGGVFAFLSTKMAPILTKFPILQSVFTGLTGPIGIAIAVIGGLTAAFVIAYKKSETFRNIVNGVVNSVKKVFTDFGNVIKGFKGLFTDEGYDGGIALLKSVGLSDSTIQKMDNFALKFNEFKAKIMAVVNMFKGDWMKGRSLLQWTGMDQQQIIDVENAVIKVKLFFHNLKESIINVFSAIKTFAISIGAQISAFWNKNGTEIMQALTNISNAFRTIFMAIYTVVSTVFNTLILPVIRVGMTIMQSVIRVGMNVIQSVMSVVWMVVKALVVSTWNNIKGVIQGALNIIMGVIKVFSSLFTGNWKGLWSGIKQILKGAVQLVWNLINLWFVGKILGTVRVFGGLFKGLFSGIWNVVKKIFSTALSAVFNSSKRSFTNIFNIGKSIFNALRGFFSAIWNGIRNIFTSTLGRIWSGVKNSFSRIFNFGRDTFTKLKNTMSNLWNTIKENTVGKAEAMKKKVTGIFGGMKDGIKKHVDKIKDHIGNMTKGVKKGLNKLIGGVNGVGAKLGMDKIPEVKLHTGTGSLTRNGKLAQDTFATVGDKGRGNGPNGFRHEMIRYPNGKTVLTPNRDTKAFLPKGSEVFNGAQTHAMFSNGTFPRFHKGTGTKAKKGDNIFSDVVNGGKAVTGKVVDGGKAVVNKTLETAAKGKAWLNDKIGDVMDWIDDPAKLLQKVLEGFGVDMSSFGIPKKASLPFDMMKGMFKKLKDGAIKTFKSWFDEQGSDGGYIDLAKGINFPFSPNGRAPGYPFPQPHMGVDLNYVYDKLYSVMGGKATARSGYNGGFGNMVDIVKGNMKVIYGHMSKHAFKGSKDVKPGDYLGVSGDTGMSSGPHLHLEVQKNGVPIDPIPWLKKNNGSGKNTAGKNWSSEIRRAARQMKVSITEADVSAINAQIMRESSGNQNIVQSSSVWDVNTASGNPAQGLLQYIPQTFRAYAVRGHNNIRSGYDQLLAFFNNSNWRRDNPGGRSGWGPTGSRRFATGGLIKNAGWYIIFIFNVCERLSCAYSCIISNN